MGDFQQNSKNHSFSDFPLTTAFLHHMLEMGFDDSV